MTDYDSRYVALTANTQATVTFANDWDWVEVVSLEGLGRISWKCGGAGLADVTQNENGSKCLPAAVASSGPVGNSGNGNTIVNLISPTAQTVYVEGRKRAEG